MRKNYSTPTLVANGDLPTHTKAPMPCHITLDGAPFQKNPSSGDVGFGL